MAFRKPNLFLVGAIKAGTTSMWARLRSHPQIFMCQPKEPCFFIDPAQLNHNRVTWTRAVAGDERGYLELFARAPEGARVLGEASVLYTQLPTYTGVPGRMVRFNPEARILYLVRDPVARAISHYRFALRRGHERREPREAITPGSDYVSYSRYALQLRPYLALFGPEQVRVVATEDFAARPAEVLRELFRWLEVDAAFDVPDLDVRHMVTGARVYRDVGPELVHRLRRTWTAHRLGRLLPGPVRSLLHGLVTREVARASVAAPALLERLRGELLGPTEELAGMLGRRFEGEWTTLYGAAPPVTVVPLEDDAGELVGHPGRIVRLTRQ